MGVLGGDREACACCSSLAAAAPASQGGARYVSLGPRCSCAMPLRQPASETTSETQGKPPAGQPALPSIIPPGQTLLNPAAPSPAQPSPA